MFQYLGSRTVTPLLNTTGIGGQGGNWGLQALGARGQWGSTGIGGKGEYRSTGCHTTVLQRHSQSFESIRLGGSRNVLP